MARCSLPMTIRSCLGSGGEIDKARFGMSWIGEAHAVPIMEQRELVDGFVKDILGPTSSGTGA